MDCRHFQKHHASFVDNLLPGVQTWAMRDHLAECDTCAHHDTRMRRALMIARSAHTIEPSKAFRESLAARLAAERTRTLRPAVRPSRHQARWRTVAAAAAVIVALAGATTIGATHSAPAPAPADEASLAPAPAQPQIAPPSPLAAPVAATAEPIAPVHPAVLMAQRAAADFVASRVKAATAQTH
jgi:hypothetical protein